MRTLPERVQRLLSYQVGAHALGYIDGGRSPMDLLRGRAADVTAQTLASG